MTEILNLDESRKLIKLCQQGQLFEIKDWIEAGKSIRMAPEIKKSLLPVALKTGFHSLVETIAPHETQDAKNQGLAEAVSQRRLDLVELLVAYGAEIKTVPFSDALLTWEPHIIQFFLDNGADIITGSPFAVAFGQKIRTALGPFLRCKQRYLELTTELQEQVDRALRKFAHDGDLKWVSLLMWAGANPRSRGPALGDEHLGRTEEEKADYYTTALEQACYQENVEVLKRLGPDPKRDKLAELLECAAFGHKEIIKFLLELGANPNDKPNGGSTAADRCLSHLDFEAVIYRQRLTRWKVHRTMECLEELIKHRAIWNPDNSWQMSYVRRTLYRADPEVAVDLLTLFIKNKSCSEETLRELLRPPKMRQHLTVVQQNLLRLGLDLRTPREKAEQARAKEIREAYYFLTQYNREQLYDEVWSEPTRTVSKKYGLSDVGLAKVCKKLKIPRPGIGYWAKKAAGKYVGKRSPLPPFPKPS